MSSFKKVYSKFEDIFAGIFFFSGISLIFYGVICRYVFGSPLYWVDEISTYILVWGCILGWSIAQRDGRHIRVGILYDYLSVRVRWYISIFASFASIVFCFFLAYLGYVLEVKYLTSGQQSMNTQFPLWAVYVFVPVAALMLSARFVEEMYGLLKNGGKDWLEDRKKGVSHHGNGPAI